MHKSIKVSKGGVVLRDAVTVTEARRLIGCQGQNIYKALTTGYLVDGYKVELNDKEYHDGIAEFDEFYSTGNKEYALNALNRALHSLRPTEDIDF